MFPETPEGVALALFTLILSRDKEALTSKPSYLIQLFAECLDAVRGEETERQTEH